MGKFDVNAPPPRDYAAEGKETIAGQLEVAPDVYAAEAEYGPKYAALDRDTFKESVRDLGPFIESDVMPLLSRLERGAQRTQREGDISDIEEFGARATRAMREATPELTRSLDRVEGLNQDPGIYQVNPYMASSGGYDPYMASSEGYDPYMARSGGYDPYMLGRGERVGDARMGPSWMQKRLEYEAATGLMAGRDLTRREEYDAQQSSRAAYEDRGLGRSQGALAAEVLNLDSVRHARQRDRQGFAAGVERLGQPIRMADQQAQLRSAMFNVAEQRAREMANQYSYNVAAQHRIDAGNRAELSNQYSYNAAAQNRSDAGNRAQLANQYSYNEAAQNRSDAGNRAELANQYAYNRADEVNVNQLHRLGAGPPRLCAGYGADHGRGEPGSLHGDNGEAGEGRRGRISTACGRLLQCGPESL